MVDFLDGTIQSLLVSELSNTKISKDTGVERSLILSLQNGSLNIEDIEFEDLKKLYDYQYDRECRKEMKIISYQNAMREINSYEDYKTKENHITRMNGNIRSAIDKLLDSLLKDPSKYEQYIREIRSYNNLLIEHKKNHESDLDIDRTSLLVNEKNKINKIKLGNDVIDNTKIIKKLNEIISKYCRYNLVKKTERTIIFNIEEERNEELQEKLRNFLDDEVYSYNVLRS